MRKMKLFLSIPGSLLTAFLVLTVLIGGWVSQEPRSLSFLNPYVEARLNHNSPYRVEFGDIVLVWAGWKRALDVRLQDVEIKALEHGIAVNIPQVSLDLRFLSLIEGDLVFNGIEVFQPVVTLRVSSENPLFAYQEWRGDESGNGQTGIGPTEMEPTEMGVESLASILGGISFLEHVALHDVRLLILSDQETPLWEMDNLYMVVDRTTESLSGDFSFDFAFHQPELESGKPDSPPSALRGGHLAAFWQYDFEKDTTQLEGHIDRLEADMLPYFWQDLAFFEKSGFLFSGDFSLALDSSRRLQQARFDLRSQGGRLDIGLGKEAVLVDQLVAQGRFSAADHQQIVIERLAVKMGETQVSISALIEPDNQEIAVRGKANLYNFSVDQLNAYWPQQANAGAKIWLQNNLFAGHIQEADTVFSLSLRKGGIAGAFSPDIKVFYGRLSFSDLGVRYFKTMPPLTQARGYGFFSSDRLELTVTGGQVEDMQLRQGYVHLTQLDTDFEQSDIQAVVEGPLENFLHILDHKPIEARAFLGIEEKTVGGMVRAHGMFRFPMIGDLKMEQVAWEAAMTTRGVTLDKAAAGYDLEKGNLAIELDRESLSFKGEGILAGIPVGLSGIENFSPLATSFRSRYEVSGIVKEAATWRDFGMESLSAFLSGPVDMTLIWTDYNGEKSNLAIAANLEKARIRLALLEWEKQPAEPGSARVNIALNQGRFQLLDQFSLNAAGLEIQGKGEFDPTGRQFTQFTLDPLRVNRHDFTLKALLEAGTPPVIELGGAVIDFAPFLSQWSEETTGSQIPENDRIPDENKPVADGFSPVSVDIDIQDIETVWLGETVKISNVSGTLKKEAGSWQSVNLQGYTTPETQARFSIGAQPDSDNFNTYLKIEDVGSFLRTRELYPYMLGGNFVLNGQTGDTQDTQDTQMTTPSWNGDITITDFEITKAPVFARLLSLASLDGLVERLSGSSLNFRQLSAATTFSGQQLTIDGYASGATGVTFKGVIDFKDDRLDIEGNIIPSYALNSLLSDIPILGDVLTGLSEQEGVFAFTYELEGDFSRPRMRINPLSVLTPALFRDFLGMFRAEDPQSPSVQDGQTGSGNFPFSPDSP